MDLHPLHRPQHRPQTRPQHCPQHGALVHELVLGRLAEADVPRAEQALAGCETCRAWYEALAHPEVARGVAEAVASFRPPAVRPPAVRPTVRPAARRWPLRAAAALALATAGVAAWTAREGLPEGDGAAGTGRDVRPAGEVILAEGLESGGPGDLETTVHRPEVIFADDLESGGLGAWRSSS